MNLFKSALIAACCFSAPIVGADKLTPPNWDATLAVQTASQPGSEIQLQVLFEHLRNADRPSLEQELEAVITGASLSQPERDAILFRFTVGLADFDDVDPEIIYRLLSIRPTVMVPHEERASVGVPLFDIAGAAEGVLRLHQRLEAAADAEMALSASGKTWVDTFLLANPSQRLGFTDALNSASNDELTGILIDGLNRLSGHPELTPVVGKSALLTGDSAALMQVARDGQGADLARILEAAGHTLPQADTLALLHFAITEAPAVNAALAIAQLFPSVAGIPEASELLLNQLADADLGGAAALALAAAGNSETRARLRLVAEDGEGPAAARARIALTEGSAYGGPEQ